MTERDNKKVEAPALLRPEEISEIYPTPTKGHVLVLKNPIEDGWALLQSPVEVEEPLRQTDDVTKFLGAAGVRVA